MTEPQSIRLSKALAIAGIAARRKAELIIQEGRVEVNDLVITLPQHKVDPNKDRITVDAAPLPSQEKKVYFLLNKPPGFLCSHQAPKSTPKVIDLFAHLPYRLFTVGRLDKDTSGLLIITNDGLMANTIIHPSSNIDKEYLVKTREIITYHHLTALRRGTRVEGVPISPVKVTPTHGNGVKIVVREGKKHEIRLLAAAAGLKVLSLARIRIGNFSLGNLPLGSYRTLSYDQCKKIFD